jgi:hypothetical protein
MSINLLFFLFFVSVAGLGCFAYIILRDKLITATDFAVVWAVWVMLLVLWGIWIAPTSSYIQHPAPNPHTYSEYI